MSQYSDVTSLMPHELRVPYETAKVEFGVVAAVLDALEKELQSIVDNRKFIEQVKGSPRYKKMAAFLIEARKGQQSSETFLRSQNTRDYKAFTCLLMEHAKECHKENRG
jgi:hypothetical protein